MSAQAVGNAVAHNPVSVIVPCHRVLGSKGSLTGYAGGLERKIKLLELEKVPDTEGLFLYLITFSFHLLRTFFQIFLPEQRLPAFFSASPEKAFPLKYIL